ncbi:bestrophin-4-like [Gigantopelta aegis]|uniref:bestrophin-4-like n=1 Tax=Gigantopelta aegis TaxID=1735272 RepID=UPI001B8880E2|nr:bestrophin-4-like [Gigantopelta aegis]XP_041374733.1 bestrophin-4-like [Gigantopelta aegis]XP_041374734.1 bestrophin-4-like [Gigantopelta aegis]
MTITYQYRVATASLGGFVKLLAAWKGSVYKLMYKEMILFVVCYTAISLIYRLLLNEPHRRIFEQIVIHFNHFTSLIPVSFVLGFFVAIVVSRWWQQFMNIPWPDRTLFILNTYLHGHDERARIMRRSIARYMLFGLILICRSVSVAVMKRFPTIEHICEAGFITKEEAIAYEDAQCEYNKFWVPLVWANSILVKSRKENKIETDFGLRMVIEQLADFRDKCSLCFVYDWISIPLVYTQVVTLAVYMFFAACLLGRQFLDPSKSYEGYESDFYIPVFTFLQFFFYMGWLKVAEQLINPFGEDDDDYDINWLIDRHTAVAFALVDQCYNNHPPLIKDQFWNDVIVCDLPYTEASINSKKPIFMGSTFNIELSELEDQRLFVPDMRSRRKSSIGSIFSGSVLSLFQGRQKSLGSRDTLQSYVGHGPLDKRSYSLANGKGMYLQVPNVLSPSERRRRASIDVAEINMGNSILRDDAILLHEGRARAHTDHSDREAELNKHLNKKLNVQVNNMNYGSKNGSQKISDHQSPSSSRFVVDFVPDDESNSIQANNSRRSGQVITDKQFGKSVSRAPVLSAIEEGNTVTSLRQILMEPDAISDSASFSDAFDDDQGLGLLSATGDSSSIHSLGSDKGYSEYQPLKRVHLVKLPSVHVENC